MIAVQVFPCGHHAKVVRLGDDGSEKELAHFTGIHHEMREFKVPDGASIVIRELTPEPIAEEQQDDAEQGLLAPPAAGAPEPAEPAEQTEQPKEGETHEPA